MPCAPYRRLNQFSRSLAARFPFDDFDTNAARRAPSNLLEAAPASVAPHHPSSHIEYNKVYGDRPNTIQAKGTRNRWDLRDPAYGKTGSPKHQIDQRRHSLFGCLQSRPADIAVQRIRPNIRRLPTCWPSWWLAFDRLPNHHPLSAFELHGLPQCFLSNGNPRS